MYCFLVLGLGLNPEYVADKMDLQEAKTLIKFSWYKSKEEWEQSRLVSYIQAQSQSTKKLKMKDIIEFPWEKEETEHNTSASNEDRKRLEAKAKQMEEYFKNNNNT